MSGDKSIIMLMDDYLAYSWLYPSEKTSAETAAHALLDFPAAFGAPLQLMSDGPTHFKNETICLLINNLSPPNHFTLPYCPWSN